MMTTKLQSVFFAALASAALACAPSTTGTTTVPTPVPGSPEPTPATPVITKAPLPAPNPGLPPVPTVTGPLEIKVVYPDSGQLIQSKDSNFIFGSVGNGDAALSINGISAPVWPNGSFMAWLPNPPADAPRYDIVATTGLDTARLSLAVKIKPLPTIPPPPPDTIQPLVPARFASLIGPPAYASDTDRVITGYSLAGGIQRWFLMPNTVVKVTGTKGSDDYVQLDSTKTIRIDKGDVSLLDSAFVPVARNASAFKLTDKGEWTDVVIPICDKPSYYVEEGPSGMTLTLYGTNGPAKKQLGVEAPPASYIKTVTAMSDGPQMKYAFDLKGPIYGYLVMWQEGSLTFRVRRPPKVDPASPLLGRTIAIDPGHPPVGATGPTGLWEPEATLAVGFKVQELLQAKGVKVIMTRSTPDPVDLYVRPAMARRENAEAFVSIHLNAVPDGQNPFRAQGTATYHYYLHSAPLADSVDRTAVAHLALPDKGVKRENFAVIRGTWMPSILVEGAFIIMPDQEAALRTPEYQLQYAQGIVDGLENYFRGLAQQR
ncbi:MAG TPA: N-acetylmuramoyl-L-alanine amidase [Gemmatimonadaceae bacterium]|nr:N-acetylmuramoyl-L-alanine amidase [Gemmatimonadaceae bacterium]